MSLLKTLIGSMTYNWQKKDWRKFTFSTEDVEAMLYTFAEKTGHQKGLLNAITKDTKEETIIEIGFR